MCEPNQTEVNQVSMLVDSVLGQFCIKLELTKLQKRSGEVMGGIGAHCA
jgi:hypothetical protein